MIFNSTQSGELAHVNVRFAVPTEEMAAAALEDADWGAHRGEAHLVLGQSQEFSGSSSPVPGTPG